MRLSQPSPLAFYISAALFAVALLSVLGIVSISFAGISTLWIALAAWAVLAAGVTLKGF